MAIKVTTTNAFASATVTASSTGSGFDRDNVKTYPIKRRWRSNSPVDQWLKFDLGSATAISSFSLSFHNLTSSATIKLYGHSSDLGNAATNWDGSASFDSNNTLSRDDEVAVLHISSDQSYRWWFLELDDPTNSDGYIEIGTVFGGDFESPDENFNENFSLNWLDSSRTLDSEGQSRFTVEKERFKVFEITFADMDSANQDTIEGWWKAVYKTAPFLVALDTDSHPAEWTRLVHWDNDLSWVYGPNERATTTLVLKEVR